ncbi:MAG: hypothetical protein KAH20_04895 [Methylococcales bacterium]|nr:hypothetical protein [Methylococcales bacterium]
MGKLVVNQSKSLWILISFFLFYSLAGHSAENEDNIWANISPIGGDFDYVVFSPSDPNIVYAVSGRFDTNRLLFKSHDSGNSWKIINDKFKGDRLVVHSEQPNTLLYFSRDGCLRKSIDSGVT